MRIGIVGTGFVADYYMMTLVNHPVLELAGVFDVDAARLKQFSAFHDVSAYGSYDALLADETVDAIVVLTTPETHYQLTSKALEAGKHVYCEKPLAMDLSDAHKLVAQADQAGLILAGAPANARSNAFDMTKRVLDDGRIGAPKLVYAEMEDGAVFREAWQKWRSESGAPWPGKHEFEIGCTLEHAGYGISWLIGLFGSIKRISGTSATLFMDKGVEIAPDKMAPDFSTAVLEFEGGVIARLTCGLCAPKDRSMTIMGDKGTLTVADLWDNGSDIYLEREGDEPSKLFKIFRRIEARRGKFMAFKPPLGRKLSYFKRAKPHALPSYPSQIDFCAGVDAIWRCLEGQGPSRTQLANMALHSTEAVLVLNRISNYGGLYDMTTLLASDKDEA